MILSDEKKQIDPVTMTVINGYLETTAREMGIAMKNTSYSTLFNEGLDFSCAVLDWKGELIAQGEFNPAQIGAMPLVSEWTINEIGLENFKDGDVILHNDPYRGGCHLPEYCVLMPIFYDSELFAFVSTIGHMTEVGGMTPAGFPGDAVEIFQEGLRFPPVKIVDRGKDAEDIWNIMLANVRTPRCSYGDVKAMIGSCYIGKKRLIELIDRYELEYFKRVIEELKNYSEKRMRNEIKEMPEGRSKWTEVFADNDGIVDKKFKIKVEVTIKDGEMIVDYHGSDSQAKGPVNATYGVASSGTWNAILHLTSKDIPINSGKHRPIRILAPPGSVLNVEYPGPCVGGNSETHPHIVDAVFGALKKVLKDKVPAEQGGTAGIVTFGGIHPDTDEPYALLNVEPVGWGGRPFTDGHDAVCIYNANCPTIPVEVLEYRFPIIHEEFKLRKNSCGAGKYRGGLGTIRSYKIMGDMRLSSFVEREKTPPAGYWGGKDAKTSKVEVKGPNDKSFTSFKEKFNVPCAGKFSGINLGRGYTIRIQMPGGGGWGNPLKRDFNSIIYDVSEGFISKKDAEKDYHIVLRKVKGKYEVDKEKTAQIRNRFRKRSAR